MKLALFSSVPKADAPNLVGLQDEAVAAVPTVLVCPLRASITLTPFRVEVSWHGTSLIACPELARPIRRTALRLLGRLDADLSREIMSRFRHLLAR